MVFALTDEITFPDPHYGDPDGLLAVGGDLSTDRLILAYSNGIFPWYTFQEGMIQWWCPLGNSPSEIDGRKIYQLRRIYGAFAIITTFAGHTSVNCKCSSVLRPSSYAKPSHVNAFKSSGFSMRFLII